MFRNIIVLAVAVLMSSVALGDDAQLQGFSLEGLNGAGIAGTGSAANNNVVALNNSQLNTNNVSHDTTYQGMAGALLQSAGTVGMGGVFNVGQVGDVGGAQLQAPSLGIHTQDLNANLVQDVLKVGTGMGTALGLQTFVGIQTQLSFNPWGGSANIQGVGTTVYNAAGGGPAASMEIGGGANIGVGQTGLN